MKEHGNLNCTVVLSQRKNKTKNFSCLLFSSYNILTILQQSKATDISEGERRKRIIFVLFSCFYNLHTVMNQHYMEIVYSCLPTFIYSSSHLRIIYPFFIVLAFYLMLFKRTDLQPTICRLIDTGRSIASYTRR